MHHAPGPVLPQELHRVAVGLPVVDHHRQSQLLGQLQLGGKDLLLALLGAGVQPVVVQADFAHRHHFRLL